MSSERAQRIEHEPIAGAVAAESHQAAVSPRQSRMWVENRPPRSWWPRVDVAELWASRDIAYFLALRNIKVRYKQTFFGVAWAVLQPLLAVAIFSVLMGRLVHVPSEGIPYPVFAFAGLILWLYFSNAAMAATDSLAAHRELVTKVYFPRLLAPLAAVLPGLVDLGVSLLPVAAFMVAFGVVPSAAIVLLPLWVVATTLFVFGVGTWLAALNVKYRDVRNVIAFLLQLWFFVTPVVYGSSLLSGRWEFVVAINPVAGLIEGFRWSLVGASAPDVTALFSLGVGAVVVLSGIAYFARVERFFADLI
jgi:homopolymeric O-antigen transport system permease protein